MPPWSPITPGGKEELSLRRGRKAAGDEEQEDPGDSETFQASPVALGTHGGSDDLVAEKERPCDPIPLHRALH